MKKIATILLAIVLLVAVGWAVSQFFAPTAEPSPTTPPRPTVAAQVPATPTPASSSTPQLTQAAGRPAPTSEVPTQEPTSPPPSPLPTADPFALISEESLLDYVVDLTAIQPYSGWRNSTSVGEAEALDYVTNKLGEFEYLQNLGMELERQEFRVFMGTELWDTQLHLTVQGQELEVPADGLRGPRDNVAQALRFDSDGVLNDSTRDPVVVEGPVVLVRSDEDVNALSESDLAGKVVFLDYAAIDRIVQGSVGNAVQVAWELLAKEPAGLVLVTRFSNKPGESHGSFVGDASALNWVATDAAPPTLYVRLEDLAPAGISGWDDLEQIEAARLTWDADVFSPATSSNLIARVPGADPSRAMILGAHIDSPNSPGAMDDGSGSAVLLEVAGVLNAAHTQPPTDLYLAWFGSEELGLYGSAHFVATHQELVDQTQAMLQTDSLSYPLDGIDADLTLVAWSYGRLGDDRLLWPDYLTEASAARGVETVAEDLYQAYSDNYSFGGFDVPNADLIYENGPAMSAAGSMHYSAHMHDPYDTVDLAREVGDVLEQMAQVALTAALDVPPDISALRVAPRPDRRALLVASHTEPVQMTPARFTEFGMALAMEGLDVDLIPYGQQVKADALADTDLVIVLPVLDYPSADGDEGLYDEEWAAEEIAALESYVADGGLLVLTNSAHRLKYGYSLLDTNEDWSDMNALALRFGITYGDGELSGGEAGVKGDHPLLEGVKALTLAEGNGVRFGLDSAIGSQELALVDGKPAAVLLEYGDAGGQVLVLADVGMLSAGPEGPVNLPFWRNLAQYARR